MIGRVEAFDILCDKINVGEKFAATLVAQVSDGTPAGYLKLEKWIAEKGYLSRMVKGTLIYEDVRHVPQAVRRFVV